MQCDHILVDGWNVIHAEPSLCKMLARDPDAARKALAKMLAPVHDMYSPRITVVYDGNGSDVSLSRPDAAVNTFTEVFTPSSMTADEFIERYCVLAKNKSRIVVISNDNMIWQTVSVQGAVCMRIGEIVECGRRAAADINRLASEINFKTDRLWRESGGFAKLDTLELEINRIKSDLFSSKKMRKKMRKTAEKNSAQNAQPEKTQPESGKQQKPRGNAPAAGTAQKLSAVDAPDCRAGSAGRKTKPRAGLAQTKMRAAGALGELAPKTGKRRLPHIFKNFAELSRHSGGSKRR